ncbi:hypothetical protein Phum_PHUM537370 [Pediculus humanus corporis]|uniref:Uncharacterized protein n=1 Tax=Pediculus humanus subsp. corporis TaxID=121224 RepID=E0VZQ9_PEDHC|nr:uncharacterized protein Phum_PHUM537370 [Pediculus humanus corporis]EEB18865.1 hypothetical protein Phum_PHUM537370 [Pediculus humanus corporis]
MAFHVYWPALSILTLFIVLVIIVLLRWGPKFCKTRNTTINNDLHGLKRVRVLE